MEDPARPLAGASGRRGARSLNGGRDVLAWLVAALIVGVGVWALSGTHGRVTLPKPPASWACSSANFGTPACPTPAPRGIAPPPHR